MSDASGAALQGVAPLAFISLMPNAASTPPHAARAARALCFAAAAYVASGCYSEVPVAWQAAPQNREVEVTLDAAEAPSLAAMVGPRAGTLAGRVTARTDSTLSLTVTSITRTNGAEENWPGGEVVVPARAVERVTVRKLSGVRTVLVGVLLAGGGALIGSAVSDPASAPGGRPGGPAGRQ